ncbi:MAG TPA: chemotaxis protein CheA [Cyclobacteriaceae bacterium]|jgi:two-component system chemotaxis sensor kinase CheA|nr:chemotaxis protein CheA [Cyclobacteriaceae bacterium]
MDSNQKRFIEDALDLLNELDEGLLQLEANPQASAPLEQVFRTMHTIKGGANMFGFENIGELAHHLETLYDLVRQGKAQVNDGLISITLHAFDKVRDLLKEKDAAKINNADVLKDHLKTAIEFLKKTEGNGSGQTNAVKKDELATFFIRVTPTIKITADGTHPLVFIIQDLEALGTAKTFFYKKDDSTAAHWDIFLSTTTPQTEIESYFLFVENECQVSYTKLLASSLFESEEFTQFISQFESTPVDLDQVKTLVAKVGEELTKKDEEDAEEGPITKKKAFNDTYIKVSKRKIDDLLNGISELIILQAQLVTVTSPLNSPKISAVTEQLELITSQLRDTSLEIGLVPIETLVTKFKRLVRDLSKTLNKKVNFLSEGAETEMDKDVIELMAEPMIHIIRNCIDHGIEKPGDRKAAGKSEHGTVKLKAFNTSSYVNIIISDDGKGIHKENVLRKAIEKGLVSADAVLTEEEILNLIFHPGLSTASQVSDVSGRGVGMDVVRQKINDLRGYVSIKSEPGKGTSIHIKLPLSRSIIEGLLVKVDETRYVVPLNVIDRIDRISYDLLNRENHVNKSVIVNEEMLSVFSMRYKFHNKTEAPKTADVISVTVNGIKKGIAVDRIEGKMQTVMKPLGEAYQQQDFIAGSTILGDGSLALVLDPSRLFQLHYN